MQKGNGERGRDPSAFVGPSVGSIEPGRIALSPDSELDRALLEAQLDHVTLLTVTWNDVSLVEALELMASVRAGEPLLREVEDPIGFLLRDFHLALSAGDPDSSDRLLERIEGSGLLASENLRFLRVERLAKLSRWHELGSLPWFADLARARRPRHVTEYLLEALWRREFDDARVIAEPGAACACFRNATSEPNSGLSSTRSTSPQQRAAGELHGSQQWCPATRAGDSGSSNVLTIQNATFSINSAEWRPSWSPRRETCLLSSGPVPASMMETSSAPLRAPRRLRTIHQSWR